MTRHGYRSQREEQIVCRLLEYNESNPEIDTLPMTAGIEVTHNWLRKGNRMKQYKHYKLDNLISILRDYFGEYLMFELQCWTLENILFYAMSHHLRNL